MTDLLNYVQTGEFASDLALIEQTAAGALSHHDDGEQRDEVTQAVQQVLEFLFSRAGGNRYRIPAEFWEGELGRMIAAARLWSSGDELMTHSEAAQRLRGSVTKADLVYVQRLVQSGRLTRYYATDEPNWTKAGRVSRAEVEALR